MDEVSSPDVAAPIGIYSNAIKVTGVADLLFVSGLVAFGPDGEVVGEGDVARQLETILDALAVLLAEAGGSLADVVKVTVFVTDMTRFDSIHEVRRRYFAPPYPASTMVEVSALVDPRLEIEVEAVAALGASKPRP
jgi:2-iminobutanoate/2-iminopropanoate deaminase